MRGNPWYRIGFVVLAILAMGFPIWRITEAQTPAVAAAAVVQPVGSAQTLTVTVDFTHPPTAFALTNDGKPILFGNGPKLEYRTTWSVNMPKEGVDLLLIGNWAPGVTKTAVRVKVESDHVLTDRSFWSDGAALTELVTVQPDVH